MAPVPKYLVVKRNDGDFTKVSPFLMEKLSPLWWIITLQNIIKAEEDLLSLQRNGLVSKREMGVLSGQSGDILGPGLAGWCTPAAECASSVEAEEPTVSQRLYTWAMLVSLLRSDRERSSAVVKATL